MKIKVSDPIDCYRLEREYRDLTPILLTPILLKSLVLNLQR